MRGRCCGRTCTAARARVRSRSVSVKDSTDRIVFLDGLRGIAAMSVVVLHLLAEPLGAVSSIAAAIAAQGFLGVYVFFVISGFAVATAISKTRMDLATFGRFIARRACRLDPPYWASMVVSVVIAVAATLALGRSATVFPTPKVVLANIFYLQALLDVPSIQDVYWTLCFEIQFYLMLVILVALKERLTTRLGEILAFNLIFLPPLFYSVLVAKHAVPAPSGACFRDWYAFFAGVAVQRVLSRRDWIPLGLAVGSAVVVALGSAKGVTVIVVAAAIVVGNALNRLGVWLSGGAARYLGRISYSLYLTHLPVGGRAANLLTRLTGNRPWPRLMAGLMGVVIAICFAHLFWVLIEKPSIALSHRISPRRKNAAPPPAGA
jgi:peptidoglycan/LPS O-acetylase OafA/YrhL